MNGFNKNQESSYFQTNIINEKSSSDFSSIKENKESIHNYNYFGSNKESNVNPPFMNNYFLGRKIGNENNLLLNHLSNVIL